MMGKGRSGRYVTWLTAALIFAAAATPPAAFFLSRFYSLAGALETEAEVKALAIGRIVSADPGFWRYQEERLREIADAAPVTGAGGHWHLMDAAGRVIVESPDKSYGPSLVRVVTIRDAGSPVGTIEVSHPLLPLMGKSAVWFLLLGFLAAAITRYVTGIMRNTLSSEEEKLRRSEERYRGFFDAMPEAFLLFDRETFRCIDANRAAELLYGRTRSGLLSLEIDAFVSGSPETLRLARDTGAGSARSLLHYHRKKDGTVFAVEVTEGGISLAERETILWLVKDLTERQRYQDRLLRYQLRLRGLAEALASAEDRQRRELAESLHDELGQFLAVALQKLGPAATGEDRGGEIRDAAGARDLVARAIDRVRSLTAALGSPALHTLGLSAALEQLCRQVGESSGLEVRFESDGEPRTLSTAGREVLYRAARELLANAVKHAGAREVRVRLSREADAVGLRVADDGTGFIPPRPEAPPGSEEGFGLFSVRERLRAFGGSLTIDSSPLKGSTVTAVLPTPADDLPARGAGGAGSGNMRRGGPAGRAPAGKRAGADRPQGGSG